MKRDNAAKRLLRGQIKELCSQGDTWRDQHNWKLGEIGNWGELEIGGNWKLWGIGSSGAVTHPLEALGAQEAPKLGQKRALHLKLERFHLL